MVSDTKSTQENRETLVSKILAEGKENNLDCKQLVTKLDIEIIELDLKLDQGAKNEEELLAERESLVGCRLSQPCHAEVVTPVAPCCGHAVEICTCEQPIEIIEETILCEEEILVEEPLAAAPMMGCGYGSSCGMGGGGGGGGMGGLALAGLAGLAGLDDDDNVVYVRP
ncbi:hypothetical protein RRSWK_03743 [Rhodopirellula sp. SWK7]|nr:hypothetical protein RRSWK_03743 [Rhodopirellula sp. SWK7]